MGAIYPNGHNFMKGIEKNYKFMKLEASPPQLNTERPL